MKGQMRRNGRKNGRLVFLQEEGNTPLPGDERPHYFPKRSREAKKRALLRKRIII